jgi:hypothetical protein
MLATTVAIEYMTTVSESAEVRKVYEKEGFEYLARFDEGQVIVTML